MIEKTDQITKFTILAALAATALAAHGENETRGDNTTTQGWIYAGYGSCIFSICG
jgi:hypothetical protein